MQTSQSGGIGRRAGLKNQWGNTRAGSNPASGTSMRIGIVGGGIAGISLASSLLNLAPSFEIYLWDSSFPGEPSPIAPGLFNVVTGKRPVLTPNAFSLHKNLIQWIKTLPSWKNWVLFTPIYRPLQSTFHLNEWARKISSNTEYSYFCSIDKKIYQSFQSDYGNLIIHHCGVIKLKYFLREYKSFLKEKGVQIIPSPFHHEHLQIKQNACFYDQSKFHLILFCEGFHTLSNPFWVRSGPKPLKGETLLLTLSQPLQLPGILIKNGYFIPHQNGKHLLIGSTHEHQFASISPSEEGKQKLLQKFFSTFPKQPFQIISHQSGIRLTTPNRRPILGLEPYWENKIGFFCGLGTKGLLYAPSCAYHLAMWILEKEPIPSEFQLERLPLK